LNIVVGKKVFIQNLFLFLCTSEPLWQEKQQEPSAKRDQADDQTSIENRQSTIINPKDSRDGR